MAKHCTGFFDTWVKWKKPTLESLYIWEVFYLGELCEEHDEECSSHTFFNALIENKVVGGVAIGTVAIIACWVKYPSHMKERL